MTLTTCKRCLLSTLALLTFFSIVSAHEQSSDHYTMPKDVLSNGGDKSKSSNYQMVATVGQHATRKGTANGNVLYSGFYAPSITLYRDRKQKQNNRQRCDRLRGNQSLTRRQLRSNCHQRRLDFPYENLCPWQQR